MSFNINPPDNKPIIREAQNMQNDGGGGNLGYMQQGENKGEEHKEENPVVNFEPIEDKFIKESEKEIPLPHEPNLIERIVNFIKSFFKPKYNVAQSKDEFLSTKEKKED